MANRMAILCHGTGQTTMKEKTNIITRLQMDLVATSEFKMNMIVMQGFGTKAFESNLKSLDEDFPWYHQTFADQLKAGSTMDKALDYVGKEFLGLYKTKTAEWPNEIFLIGWSRGGVLAVQIANRLDKMFERVGLQKPKLYLCLLDPCYGPSSDTTKETRCKLTCQARDLRMIFAMERKRSKLGGWGLFPPHPPAYAPGCHPTNEEATLLPGNHRGIVEEGAGQEFGKVNFYVRHLVHVWLAGHGIPDIVVSAFSKKNREDMWSIFLKANKRHFHKLRWTKTGLPPGNENIQHLYDQNRGGCRTGRKNYFRTKEHYEAVKILLYQHSLAGLNILECLNDTAPIPKKYSYLLGDSYEAVWKKLDEFDPEIQDYVKMVS